MRLIGTIAGIALLVAIAFGTYSCSSDTGQGDPDLKVYRHSFDEAPRSLDPARAATVYSNFIVLNTYDTLYAYKYLARPYELKPNLADGMPAFSDDGLTLTVRLKRGVHYIDDPVFEGGKGREVTAHDFVYSLKRHFDPRSLSQGAWFWQGRIVGLDAWGEAGADYAQEVEGLRALDSHTVQITLTRPYPQITHTLAQGFAALVPREAVDEYGRELSVRPVGSGPFIVEDFDSTRAVLRRNPDYRSEPVDLAYEGYDEAVHGFSGVKAIDGRSPPFVDRIEIDFISDDSSRMTSFTKGDELHYARLPSAFYDNYLKSKAPIALSDDNASKYHMLAGVEPGFVFHQFNLDDPILGYHDDPAREAANKALRCAIIQGFDWEARNNGFYGGVAVVFPGTIPPVVPEFDETLSRDSVTRDVNAAKALLAQAGWTPETLPELTYGVPSSVRQTQMFEQFRGFMQDIGYPRDKIVIKQYATFGDISKAWKQSQLPIVNKAWSLDFPDAENTLQLYYGPNGSPGSNDANYKNPGYDALYERAAVMQPGPERTALYQQMNRMIVDDCVAMTGLSRTIILLWHKNVIAFPDRNIVGGFWAKYVDLTD